MRRGKRQGRIGAGDGTLGRVTALQAGFHHLVHALDHPIAMTTERHASGVAQLVWLTGRHQKHILVTKPADEGRIALPPAVPRRTYCFAENRCLTMVERAPEEQVVMLSHAILLLDGSRSMILPELLSEKPKHRAVAEMVQDVIRSLKEDGEVQNTLLTVECYDGRRVDDYRLQDYDIDQSEEYYLQPPYPERALNKWDPLIGHGGTTPIGRALRTARQYAEQWVSSAPRGLLHRAVICLMSDGMSYPPDEPDGTEEKEAVEAFNRTMEEQRLRGGQYKGRIRIATVGYFQYPPGQDAEEDQGRALLLRLALPEKAYYETRSASTIAQFLKKSLVEFR